MSCRFCSRARHPAAVPRRGETSPAAEIFGTDPATLSPIQSFPAGVTADLEPDGSVRRLQTDDLASGIADEPGYSEPLSRRDYASTALYFLQRYRAPFRLEDPANELAVVRTQDDDIGYHQVWLSQRVNELPVLGSAVVAHLSAEDRLYMVLGKYVSTPTDLDLVPALTTEQALAQTRKTRSAAVPANDPVWHLVPPRRYRKARVSIHYFCIRDHSQRTDRRCEHRSSTGSNSSRLQLTKHREHMHG